MIDDKIAQDEAQRTANYEAIKTDVKSGVGGEIAAEAQRPTVNDSQRIDHVAGDIRQQAVSEVVETHNEVARGRTLARVSQIIDYIFFVIYGLLTVRLLLELFAAKESAGFVQLIKSATGLLYAPFQGIMPSPSKDGFTLALPIIVAIVVYMLVHFAINGLLRIFAHRKTAI